MPAPFHDDAQSYVCDACYYILTASVSSKEGSDLQWATAYSNLAEEIRLIRDDQWKSMVKVSQGPTEVRLARTTVPPPYSATQYLLLL